MADAVDGGEGLGTGGKDAVDGCGGEYGDQGYAKEEDCCSHSLGSG